MCFYACAVSPAACVAGHLSLAKWLVDECGCGEDVRKKDRHDLTPLFVACFRGHKATAQWLCEVKKKKKKSRQKNTT
jgi:hypothetical protein